MNCPEGYICHAYPSWVAVLAIGFCLVMFTVAIVITWWEGRR